ncbi:14708_t:CDS:2 [Funneliformis geosporum]|uniref:14708_t:CDS:1 n=1 Tax=Funneliformis geosporum TaxID=1117311 RepID=A0A9W4WVQ1_9GLOM|nr:14708_t:CDS:2 [Funneliformis geosporum]
MVVSQDQRTAESDIISSLNNSSKGLYYLHYQNIIHQDLHSGNILLKSKYDIVINDLGLSKLSSELSNYNETNETNYGIIPYMAPKVLQKQKHTNKSDIYSFGMIMWECMTGRRPFWDRAHDIELIIDICDGLRPLTGNIVAPEGYIELMKECWDPDQNKRPPASGISTAKILLSVYMHAKNNME